MKNELHKLEPSHPCFWAAQSGNLTFQKLDHVRFLWAWGGLWALSRGAQFLKIADCIIASVSVKTRLIAGKLRRIILFHFWTNNFLILLWENLETSICMISGFLEPWEPLLLTLDNQTTSISSR